MLRASVELVEPADLVQSVVRFVESAFVGEYGHAPWLVIRLPNGDEGMAATLRAQNDAYRPSAKPPPPLEFHTQAASNAQLRMMVEQRARAEKEPDIDGLARFITDRSYVTAVRKRLDPEGPLGDRVLIGRAMNKDIVLRHSSISKFHAYFETTETGEWSVADAGSKNGTTLNGKRLTQREPMNLANGDRVTFGSIETLFLDARTVWRLLRAI